MTKEIQVTLGLPEGLHARPSLKIINLVKNYNVTVFVLYNNQECIANSLFNLLSLCIPYKATITLKAEGPDAEEALVALADLNNKNYK